MSAASGLFLILPSIFLAVQQRQEKRTRDAFVNHQAVSPSTARPISEISIPSERALRALVSCKVVTRAETGCYYFDDVAWTAHLATRRRLGLWVLGAAALCLAVLIIRLR
jgi:hypothetical protein